MADRPEHASAAERRLDEHLALVRAAPQSDVSLAHRVVRSARLQRALREPLLLIGHIASAVMDGAAGIIGVRRRRSR